jgi:hypothetical protein
MPAHDRSRKSLLHLWKRPPSSFVYLTSSPRHWRTDFHTSWSLPFVLTDQQRAPNQQAIRDDFRDEVIAHVRRKVVLVPEPTGHDYEKIAIFLYDRVDAHLRNHETVTDDSYVLGRTIAFIQSRPPGGIPTGEYRAEGLRRYSTRVRYDINAVCKINAFMA